MFFSHLLWGPLRAAISPHPAPSCHLCEGVWRLSFKETKKDLDLKVCTKWLHRERVCELQNELCPIRVVFYLLRDYLLLFTWCSNLHSVDMYVSGERAASSHIPAISEAGASGMCCGVGRKPAGSAASACSVLTGPAQDTGTRSALPETVLQSGQLCLAPWGFFASTVKTPGTFRRHFCVLGRRGLVLGCHPSGWCQDDDTLGEPSHCENCTAVRDFRGKEDRLWWDQVCALISVTSLRSFLAEKGGSSVTFRRGPVNLLYVLPHTSW